MEYIKVIFRSVKNEHTMESIERAKAIVDSIEIFWDCASDAAQCWVGSFIDKQESDHYVEITFRNKNLDALMEHYALYKEEQLLRDIHDRLGISLMDLRYKNREPKKDKK